ncbi:hypothetical protein OG746_22585 [Streptomyces sp. NBC_01016]|uniref:hypothetical protein n=1 Tax=Streptomyces sp. NBC_01016 TaxID=2903720 RepID=UPI002253890D|nr:hypothetical protein [Streptomyces sp. NBC_01016]MCX4831527.1 hypothetical protein [Streptomyces sp. NBC_01016]
MLIRFIARATAGLFLAVVPAVLIASEQSDPAVVCCMPLSVLVCSALARPLAAECGSRPVQFAGLTALLASLSVVSLTAGQWSAGMSVWPTVAASVFAGFGHGLARGGAGAALGVRAPTVSYLSFGLPVVATGLLTLLCSAATATALVASVVALLVFPATGAALGTGRAGRRPDRRIHWIDLNHLCGNPTRSTAQF